MCLAALASAGLLACSATVVELNPAATDERAPGADGGSSADRARAVPSTVPGADAPRLLAIEPLVAFLDACVAHAELAGPCHCAARRIETGLTVADLEVVEDRMSGALEFSPDLAAALVDCREAGPPPEWSDAQRQTYLDACSFGSDRLTSLCACSVARARDVVPAHRLNDFLTSNEVQPDIVDFVNLCL